MEIVLKRLKPKLIDIALQYISKETLAKRLVEDVIKTFKTRTSNSENTMTNNEVRKYLKAEIRRRVSLYKSITSALLSMNNYALYLTGDPTQAKEIVSSAVTSFLTRYSKSDDLPRNSEAYLITIIKNKHIDFVRARDRITAGNLIPQNTLYDHIRPLPETAYPTDPLLRNKMKEALQEVGFDCKQMFYHFAKGHSYREISSILQMPEGTVSSKLYRCREKFKEHLGSAFNEVFTNG